MGRENEEPLSSPLIQLPEEDGLEAQKQRSKSTTGTGTGTRTGREEIVEEVKKQLWLAGPLICESLLLYCLQMISVMFVGHLGQLALSSASLATSFASVIGFTLLSGLSTALETLCGQSYGAKQYSMLGIHTQRAMFVLSLVSVPLAAAMAYAEKILVAIGQDPEISKAAGIYARLMIPCLFAYAFLQCLLRFLRTQNNVFPMMVSSGITTLLHIFFCWLLVYRVGLGNRGAALAISISYWINLLLLGFYVKLSPSCKHTWTGFSTEAFKGIPIFIGLAVPSAVMVCLENWSFSLMVILAGLLPNPLLETSVLSICINVTALIWMIPFGLSSAISIRISNELGAQNPKSGRLAVSVVLILAVTEGLLVGLALISLRYIWGYAYSSDSEVIRYLAMMTPFLAASYFIDGVQCVLSGIARGCGWQKIGAYINLGSYYLVGAPLAVVFAFLLHMNGKGLWLGLICALTVQMLLLLLITARTNWDEETKKAMERVKRSSTEEDQLM